MADISTKHNETLFTRIGNCITITIKSSVRGSALSSTTQHKKPNQHASKTRPPATPEETEKLLKRLMSEEVREKTFGSTWNENCKFISASKMAKAGFFYYRNRDNVQCAFCLGIMNGWRPMDDPMEMHTKHFNRCPFVKDPSAAGNIPKSIRDQIDEFGIVQARQYTHPDYCEDSSRKKTFEDRKWPISIPIVDHDLVQAGFFYTGLSDEVICYCCGARVDSWDKEDDPWIKHAQHAPRGQCTFLELKKGSGFMKNSGFGKEAVDIGSPKLDVNAMIWKAQAFRKNYESLEDLINDLNNSKIEDNSRMRKTGPVPIESDISSYSSGSKNSPDSSATSSGYASASSSPESSPSNSMCSSPEKEIDVCSFFLSASNNSRENGDTGETDMLSCKICFSDKMQVMFFPCHHVCACVNCSLRQISNCPICKEPIQGLTKAFIS